MSNIGQDDTFYIYYNVIYNYRLNPNLKNLTNLTNLTNMTNMTNANKDYLNTQQNQPLKMDNKTIDIMSSLYAVTGVTRKEIQSNVVYGGEKIFTKKCTSLLERLKIAGIGCMKEQDVLVKIYVLPKNYDVKNSI